MRASYLYPNSLNRYLLNSPMLPQFKKDPDGGLTFFIQPESPGGAAVALACGLVPVVES
jgi:hypothetical protein